MEEDEIFKVTGMPISKIVGIYEVIEKYIFAYVVDFISPEYKVMHVDNVSMKQLDDFIVNLPQADALGLPNM